MQDRTGAALLVAIVVLLIVLGIGVVLFGVPLWLAPRYQATALALFTVAVCLDHRLAWARQEAPK